MTWPRSLLVCSILAVLHVACGQPPEAPAPVQAEVRATALLASTPAPQLEAWWRQRHARSKRAAFKLQPDLVFIGDSITQGWERAGARVWDEFYAPRRAANLGVDGDRTEHVLWRLEHGALEGLEPRLVVLLIGTNNAARDAPLETLQGVAAVLRQLRERLPEAQVLLLAILPRGAGASDALRRVNDDVNGYLEELAAAEDAHFVDLSASFVGEHGALVRARMPDGLHPNAAGYRAWAEALEPYVAELLDEQVVGPGRDGHHARGAAALEQER